MAFKRIFLIDDKPEFELAIRKHLLDRMDLDLVGTARTCREAFTRISELQPDVVLLELAKPILNGMEATRILKSQPIAPVVIMTCSDELPGMQRAGLAAGADAFVSKSELIERLPLLLNGLAKASACESSSLVELA